MSSSEKKLSTGEDDRIIEFYDAIAGDYDAMTGFEKRFVEEKPFFRMLLERHHIARALDAGSGTGFHSLLLTQLGVQVVAVDVSPEMLLRLEHHARTMKFHIDRVVADFAGVEKVVKGKFDAVFSMGNTLAHILTRSGLKDALVSFRKTLNDDGILFLQLLNYDRILADRQRVQSVKQSGETLFVRFYDYMTDRLQFNILKVHHSGQGFTTELQTVPLRPVTSKELTEVLAEAGFASVKLYGGIAMNAFDTATSRDVVVLASCSPSEDSK